MKFRPDQTLYAVITQHGDENNAIFQSDPIVFTEKSEAKRHIKFDSNLPGVLYEMRPILQATHKRQIEKL